uniref:5-formyltetrahydrofolate cyclo-ligase n=1 Tax=Candidatus Aschnera chinzeii TaxID=1485666 RepID=A0AAT9G527_9ENTR|nr:MAG: 5-formyltetrahydrofolate cyclo-ligase [Candidatus Aschnera chinzeii]
MSKKLKIQKQNIRNIMRNYRKQLTENDLLVYSNNLTKIVLKSALVHRASKIGIFWSFDKEIDTKILINELFLNNKEIYLPVIAKKHIHKLIFVRYYPNTFLKKNHFNIYEPLINRKEIITLEELDILFVPLVAYDPYGYRLGMGGGFYDNILQNSKKTFFTIGLGYDFQCIKQIPVEPWDIPLQHIISITK